MITFDFIQKLHALVKKFPERREEYKMLYPEAFKKTLITEGVTFKLYGTSYMTFHLYDGERRFGEFRPHIKKGHFFTDLEVHRAAEIVMQSKKAAYSMIDINVSPGYEVELNTPEYTGFKIYRYGEKKDVVDLEFDPDANEIRIKEKS